MNRDNSFGVVEFIEIAVRDEDRRNIEARLESRRFKEVDELERASIALWERDGVHLLLNHSNEGYAADFKARQGTGPVSIGLRVDQPQAVWRKAIESGAWPVGEYIRPDLPFPALFGPDDVLLYFTTPLRNNDDLQWLHGGPSEDAAAVFSLYVDGEPVRREWNFWFDEILSLSLREPAFQRDSIRAIRDTGTTAGLRFSSRREDADLFFARSRALQGLSFARIREIELVRGPWRDEEVNTESPRALVAQRS